MKLLTDHLNYFPFPNPGLGNKQHACRETPPSPSLGLGNQKHALTKDPRHKPVWVDIAIISAASFHLNCQDSGATIFLVTLEEVDRELADHQAMDVLAEHTNSKLVTQRLPSE